jgi:carboxylesterase type B
MESVLTLLPIAMQQDEGTLFSLVLANISTNAQVIKYLASYFPNNPNAVADVTGLVANYPDQPLLGQPAGSPFNTGALNNIYPQFKRLAAILGDVTFTLTRRTYLSLISTQVKSWSYLNTYFYGTPVLGTFHGSDILVAYGTLVLEAGLTTQVVQQYYISFVNDLDPNALGTSAPLIEWPQWTNASGNPQLVNFAAAGLSLTPDTFRSGASEYLSSHSSNFRV